MMYLTRAKRRRTSNSETSSRARKRGKGQEAPEEHAATTAADWEAEGKLWSCKILEEKKEKGRTRYLVGWEDHERKSDTWKNEWKAASLVPSGLKKEWEAKKNQPEQPESSDLELSPPPESEEEPSDYEANQERPTTRRTRRPRVVESSSQPPEAKTPSPLARPDRSLEKSLIEETPDAALDIPASSPLPARTQLSLDAATRGLNPSPDVIVTQKSDFHRSDYEIGLSQAKTASQAESTQQTPVHEQVTQTSIAGTQLPTTIPDSQTESEIHTTQQTSLTEQSNGETQRFAADAVTPGIPGPNHSAQIPATKDGPAVEETPRSASSATILETDPVEPTSPAIGKHSTRRTKKLVAGLAGAEFGEALIKSSAPENLEETPKRTASRRSSVSRKAHAATPAAASSQQQSLPSTRSRLSKVEAVDVQEAQYRDRATETWLSALSGDQAADSSPSALSFSERLKDQLQSTAPEKDISALRKSPTASLPPAEENKSLSRDPEKSASRLSERTENFLDMPKTRRSLRTVGELNMSQGSNSTLSHSNNTPKSARGGRGGVSTRKTKKNTEETPQKGFDKPAEAKRRGRPPNRFKQTVTRGISMDSQTDSEAQASAVPAEEPVEPATIETDSTGRTHLPARIPADEGDDTMDTRENEDMEVDSQSGGQSTTDSEVEEDSGPSLEQMEFMVPLPMAGQARDQYRRTVKFNEELIDRFTSRKWREYDGILKKAEDFVQTMHDIVAHIDLTNNTTLSQSDVDPSDVVEWDRSVSPKFKFLWHLFDALRKDNIHIVIMARPGRLLDILENFLKGNRLQYCRPDAGRASEGSITGPLAVTLLSTFGEGSSSAVRPANLVLSLDHVVDVKNPRIRTLRTNPARPEYLAPVVSLAIVNSVDHIERSLTPNLTGVARVRVLVNCIAKLRRDAGKTEGNFSPIDNSAMKVAEFVLKGGTEDQWPLPPIGPLDNNDAWDLTQGLTSMKSSQSSDSEKSAKAKAALKSQKRRIEEEGLESAKRPRMTPLPEQDASITRISDSVGDNSSLLDKTPSESQEMIALRNLLKAAEDNLQATMKAKDARVRDLESALEDVQYRFEEQTSQKRILVRDINELRAQLEITQKQKESRDATIEKLKAENRELKAQLSDAREALKGSTLPDVVAAELLREEAEQAQEGKRKAEKETAVQTSLNGYLSQQYNEASSRAADLANLNNEMESRIKVLEKTASGEIAKARELFQDEQRKRTATENARLKAQINNLTTLLSRKDEELRNKKTGVGTRASSVPRSPRVGPASRANSPIPDRRIGALKNNNLNL
jgi:hypothetical protein